MRILHVVPRISNEASGPSYSVPALCMALATEGCQIDLVTLEGDRLVEHKNIRHIRCKVSFALHRLGVSAAMRETIKHHACSADIVHGHSLWMLPNVYPAWGAKKAGKPLVISPRGTLSPVALRRSWLSKAIFWRMLQGPAVRQATCFHATSKQECLDIRAAGLKSPIATLPNGIDIPALALMSFENRLPQRLLYLGRIHPIKGIDVLLRAWGDVHPDFPNWVLRIVGPDENGYQAKLEALVSRLNLLGVEFVGPRYGDSKWSEYAAASAYILPSHSENFGMSVAEAMACGLPVITTTGTPWIDLDRRRVGWTVTADVAGLSAGLRAALKMSPRELATIGRQGRSWMIEKFSWKEIAQNMIEVYQWLLADGALPKSVKK